MRNTVGFIFIFIGESDGPQQIGGGGGGRGYVGLTKLSICGMSSIG